MCARRKLDDFFGKCRIGALGSLFISTVFLSMPVHAQESQLVTITGALHSVTRNTMIVNAEDGLFRLYTFDRNTGEGLALRPTQESFFRRRALGIHPGTLIPDEARPNTFR